MKVPFGRSGLFLAAFLFVSLTAIDAQTTEFDDDILTGELWSSLDPLGPDEVERPPVDSELVRELLEQARQLFSGMVYGWKFRYVPYDSARNVQEELVVEPLGQILWGNDRMTVVQSWSVEKENRFYLTVRYRLTPVELKKRVQWRSQNIESMAGRGGVRLVQKVKDAPLAFDQSLKEAVRNLVRPREFNKPKVLSGEVLLRSFPVFSIQSGQVVCSSKFQIRLIEVQPYPAY